MFRRVAGKFIFSSSTLSDLVELLFWIFALRDLFIYIYAFPTSPLVFSFCSSIVLFSILICYPCALFFP
jgi:hypothetical protein